MGKDQKEHHHSEKGGWLRAAVMGANDGIISTSSLVMGVALANSSQHEILLTSVSALVAGALSMAAGEYVSVSSQADTQNADLAREKQELATNIEAERAELAGIYVSRGLEPKLARTVAEQLMKKDALAVHAREELGITETLKPKPIQAAAASAISFSTGAALPVLLAFFLTAPVLKIAVPIASLVSLFVLGSVAARIGGAGVLKGAFRVLFWGAFAIGVTAGIGYLFGTTPG